VTLRLHNTLTRQKEEFRPLDPKNVRMYVCGVTVYDRMHIGNARPMVIFDVLYRLLRRQYGAEHVTYVRNITDIDDKINNRAKELGIPISTLTAETTRWFHDDVGELGCLPPNVEPTATGTIDEIKAMIATLVEKKYAYVEQGHVLFHVPAMMERPPLPKHVYGLLSKKNRDDLIAGARIDVAPYKKDPADFVLWKPSTPDLPGWESPWGRGRPGWHIECSAMARRHLGYTFDIHGGGLDLIFPHHENEIAQSECCNGKPFVHYWMHNGYVIVGGKKMSKSLGNFLTVFDLRKNTPGEALRYNLLGTHYSKEADWTEPGRLGAKRYITQLYELIERKIAAVGGVSPPLQVPEQVVEALQDDLNTVEALRIFRDLVQKLRTATSNSEIASLLAQIRGAGALLGLAQFDPVQWLQQNAAIDENDIDWRIAERLAARKAKNFREADRIRDELAQQGVILEDGPKGTTWRRAG
jgi:cysteinyl-tRNA synthetase